MLSADAMAAWARDRDRLLAVALVAASLVVALAAALHAALLQRERVEAERARARATLADAFMIALRRSGKTIATLPSVATV